MRCAVLFVPWCPNQSTCILVGARCLSGHRPCFSMPGCRCRLSCLSQCEISGPLRSCCRRGPFDLATYIRHSVHLILHCS